MKVTTFYLVLIITISVIGNEMLFGFQYPQYISILGKILPFLILLFLLSRQSKVSKEAILLLVFLMYLAATHIYREISISGSNSTPLHLYVNLLGCVIIYIHACNLSLLNRHKILDYLASIFMLIGILHTSLGLLGIIDARFQAYPVKFLTIFSALYYFSKTLIDEKMRIANLVYLLLSVAALLTVLHKPVITSLVFGMAAIIITAKIKGNLQIVRVISLITSIATLSIILYIYDIYTSYSIRQHLYTIFANQFLHTSEVQSGELSPFEALFGGRLSLWEDSKTLFNSSPFIGLGFGQTIEAKLGSYTNIIPLHNAYIDMLISVGVLGAIFILYISYSIIYQALRRFKYLNIPSASSYASIGYILCLSFYSIGGTPILFYTVNFLTFLCIANVIYDNNKDSQVTL